jgi:hypothetical protein
VRRLAFGLLALVLGACTTPQLPNSQTAAEQFSKLGRGQKAIASNFYDLGSGDAVKRLYWAQRRAQESGGTADAQPTVLQRKYVNIPVPGYQDADGTWHEPSLHAVEVVQWLSVVLKNGKRFNLCN